MKLSIVIPLYNEEKNIGVLFSALNRLKDELPSTTEVIFVNDGSKDKTLTFLKKKSLIFKKKILSLSKNFGHQSALLAGLHKARGKYVVTMDGDLQHPPQLIPKMLDLAENGFDVVITKRLDDKTTPLFKKVSSKFFYLLINFFSQTSIEESGADFRLMNRRALDALLSLPEKRKFLRGLVNWVGYRQAILSFKVQRRYAGQSKYSLHKMIKLAIFGITSFSTLPLYFAGAVGAFLSFVSLFYGAYIIWQYFVGQTVSGWASMLLVSLIIGSFNFSFLGVIGLYIAAIYDEVKQRPEYIIQEIYEKK